MSRSSPIFLTSYALFVLFGSTVIILQGCGGGKDDTAGEEATAAAGAPTATTSTARGTAATTTNTTTTASVAENGSCDGDGTLKTCANGLICRNSTDLCSSSVTSGCTCQKVAENGSCDGDGTLKTCANGLVCRNSIDLCSSSVTSGCTCQREFVYKDDGMGKCAYLNGTSVPAGDDYWNPGVGSECKNLCDEKKECGGYSLSSADNCILYSVPAALMRANPDDPWGETSCMLKLVSCSVSGIGEICAACEGHPGKTCAATDNKGACETDDTGEHKCVPVSCSDGSIDEVCAACEGHAGEMCVASDYSGGVCETNEENSEHKCVLACLKTDGSAANTEAIGCQCGGDHKARCAHNEFCNIAFSGTAKCSDKKTCEQTDGSAATTETNGCQCEGGDNGAVCAHNEFCNIAFSGTAKCSDKKTCQITDGSAATTETNGCQCEGGDNGAVCAHNEFCNIAFSGTTKCSDKKTCLRTDGSAENTEANGCQCGDGDNGAVCANGKFCDIALNGTARCSDEITIEVSLIGGSLPSEGNVLVGGFPVCDDDWDNTDATVICKMFGYAGGEETAQSTYGQVSNQFFMDDVDCDGSEAHIVLCAHSRQDDCNKEEGAGVRCYVSCSDSSIDEVCSACKWHPGEACAASNDRGVCETDGFGEHKCVLVSCSDSSIGEVCAACGSHPGKTCLASDNSGVCENDRFGEHKCVLGPQRRSLRGM